MNEITGFIKKGTKVGSSISYPTINVEIERCDDMRGVYICEVEIDAGASVFGAGYVGEKSILSEDKFVCEVFLFDKVGDLYGKFVRIKLLKKIRDVQKVKNLEELGALISNDVKEAKKWLSSKV